MLLMWGLVGSVLVTRQSVEGLIKVRARSETASGNLTLEGISASFSTVASKQDWGSQ